MIKKWMCVIFRCNVVRAAFEIVWPGHKFVGVSITDEYLLSMNLGCDIWKLEWIFNQSVFNHNLISIHHVQKYFWTCVYECISNSIFWTFLFEKNSGKSSTTSGR